MLRKLMDILLLSNGISAGDGAREDPVARLEAMRRRAGLDASTADPPGPAAEADAGSRAEVIEQLRERGRRR